MNIDIKSVTTSQLKMSFNGQELSIGTGFFWIKDDKYYLITNWHNITGRKPDDAHILISTTGAIPNQITFTMNMKNKLGTWIPVNMPLYSDTENKMPLWLVHPEHTHMVDVVAIPFEVPEGTVVYPANSLDVSKSPDMLISIAQDIFILGYPKGLSGGGLFPIWKRATIATEPDVPIDNLPKMLVDTATREGMSGAPVFAISTGMYRDKQGNNMVTSGGGIRFVGVYSGRNIGATEIEAQLGIVWKEEVIDMIIASKQVGVSSFGM